VRATANRMLPPQKSNGAKCCPTGRVGNTLLDVAGQVPVIASPTWEAKNATCGGLFHD
jgi:hypothetical protein